MNRNKLYVFLSVACALGYTWLAFLYFGGNSHYQDLSVCLFKRITHIPCPSCGSTRAVLALVNGDITGSFAWNPFGIILAIILLVLPVWIFYDVLRQKTTLFSFYQHAEFCFKRKWLAMPLIVLVLVNWLWNIHKGL